VGGGICGSDAGQPSPRLLSQNPDRYGNPLISKVVKQYLEECGVTLLRIGDKFVEAYDLDKNVKFFVELEETGFVPSF
jgi:hypothetical protein